eukprot:CAMPEP_0206480686 /NCGR_PEP_ID=MMETSP0324_2-20121206/37568_1 /ASSEMBLY_ACC=CAM_ASM_000836 /TAXON_ID=2866 /ORGANISM="Crypthecodinium cohnii, Strain Seligo" /LENGTH=281 /DNA_ID=CAMNT_0053957773 /DNA_START=184 /DNA_END=1029 /DNA_ORIENTATION=-
MTPGAPAMPPPGVVPAMAPPGQMGMGYGPPACGLTGMDMLQNLSHVQVQEQANLVQELTAMIGMEIEMANRYRVLDSAENQLFYAVERTSCCKRQLQQGCCHDCAPWEVDMLYTPPGHPNQLFLAMRRPCQLTCCCLNRPVAAVVDQITGEKIGSFKDPCTCCSLRFHIRDENDDDVLLVDGGLCCCQPGIWCPLPCGPCSKVDFEVKDAVNGNKVAEVTKQVPGCLSWCFTPDVDNYQVEFGAVTNPKWKAIVLALTIFMDFRYFNTNRNNEEARDQWAN